MWTRVCPVIHLMYDVWLRGVTEILRFTSFRSE